MRLTFSMRPAEGGKAGRTGSLKHISLTEENNRFVLFFGPDGRNSAPAGALPEGYFAG